MVEAHQGLKLSSESMSAAKYGALIRGIGGMEQAAASLQPISAGRRKFLLRNIGDLLPTVPPDKLPSYYKMFFITSLFGHVSEGTQFDPIQHKPVAGAHGLERLIPAVYTTARSLQYDRAKHGSDQLGTTRITIEPEVVRRDPYKMLTPETETHYVDIDMAGHVKGSDTAEEGRPRPALIIDHPEDLLRPDFWKEGDYDMSASFTKVDWDLGMTRPQYGTDTQTPMIPAKPKPIEYDERGIPVNNIDWQFTATPGTARTRSVTRPMKDTAVYIENRFQKNLPAAASARDTIETSVISGLPGEPLFADPMEEHKKVIEKTAKIWEIKRDLARGRELREHHPKEHAVVLGEPAIRAYWQALTSAYRAIDMRYTVELKAHSTDEMAPTIDRARLARKPLLRESFNDALLWTGLSIRRAHEKAGVPFEKLRVPETFLEHMEERIRSPEYLADLWTAERNGEKPAYIPAEIADTFVIPTISRNEGAIATLQNMANGER